MRRTIVLTIVLAAIPAAAPARVLEPADRGDGVRVALRADGEVSRGQLRGMLRRVGRVLPRRLERLIRQSVAEPRSAPERASPTDATYAFPIDGEWEWGEGETGFGDRGGSHDGVDVMSPCGTPLVAPAAGRVVFTESGGAAGHYLVVRASGSGEHHVFMHLHRPPRHAAGDRVAAGERLGAVGRSGNASACHLHFEIWRPPGWQRGRARDPRPDLERWAPKS